MELKGIITEGNRIGRFCCDEQKDILIDGVSLYEKLDELFNQDSDSYYFAEDEKKSPNYSVKYITLDEKPNKDLSFNDLSADVMMRMLYAEHVTGCYSEWTCGTGGFDYVDNDNGHSIFDELRSYIGKWVFIQL